jgi:CheC-like family.
MLDDDKKDILKELLNISIGKAADSLSRIVGKKIILNVPDVLLYDSGEQFLTLLRKLSVFNSDSIISSTIYFGEEIKGEGAVVLCSG